MGERVLTLGPADIHTQPGFKAYKTLEPGQFQFCDSGEYDNGH
jgi:hypothetical protein